ncbi:TPA_exp: Uncharacterized protein A8136_4988 [Trichophyton benhamiae CBS 112371]|nr:TPA_exp: Uncharacterized protein A8136_4988 [Trichophyton benhamiae CBS 112371]
MKSNLLAKRFAAAQKGIMSALELKARHKLTPKVLWAAKQGSPMHIAAGAIAMQMVSVIENLNGVGKRTKDKYARVYSKDFEAMVHQRNNLVHGFGHADVEKTKVMRAQSIEH